jgi:hypothetical protein
VAENVARFSQSPIPVPTPLPPMTEPFYTAFTGPLFQSNTDDLLHGAFDCSAAPTAASCRFLEHCCRYPASVTTRLSSDIPIDDHASFWRQIPENKASEPHGLHNGHFKAAAQSKLLLTCDAAARAISYKTGGYAPRQWRNLMDFAIEKKPGELRVDLMRTIELMNTEANTNNKKVGRDVMRQAESHKMIPPEQSGSRKAHQAADLALCKRLVWDLLIPLRLAAGWCSNNAKSCFDQIVHWVATACLLRCGLHWGLIQSLFKTLQKATHHVRTGFGNSTVTFTSKSNIPFRGCGQGNGAGPTIWVMIEPYLSNIKETTSQIVYTLWNSRTRNSNRRPF